MPKVEHKPGRIGDIVRYLAEKMGVPPFTLQAELEGKFPQLAGQERCPNCGASMAQYQFRFDCLDAVLLVEMAKHIRSRMEKGLDFTAANQVHVPSLGTSLAIRCRTTQCSKLGLIAKLLGAGGKQIPGTWVITTRGWAALRGEGVPESIIVFRNEIQERTDKLITISDALNVNRAKVEAAIARGVRTPVDYRSVLAEYNPEMWVDIERYGQGELL